jgi:hypothetical protein
MVRELQSRMTVQTLLYSSNKCRPAPLACKVNKDNKEIREVVVQTESRAVVMVLILDLLEELDQQV